MSNSPKPGQLSIRHIKLWTTQDYFILWTFPIVFGRLENPIEIPPVNLACANTGAGLHLSGSAMSCWALNMYPVTLRVLNGDALRTGSLATLKLPDTLCAQARLSQRPLEMLWQGNRKCLLAREEVSNWKAPFFHFGEFSSLETFGILLTEHLQRWITVARTTTIFPAFN